MGGLAEEATQGIQKFIKEQREVDRRTDIQLVEFDDEINAIGPQDLKDALPYTLVPRGMTAMYDAIGKTLGDLTYWPKEKYKNNVCLIVTDGHENASKEWNHSQIEELITGLEGDKWEFIFMASNIDAKGAAARLGIKLGETVQLNNDAAGVHQSYVAGATYSVNLRTHGKAFAQSQLNKDKTSSGSIA